MPPDGRRRGPVSAQGLAERVAELTWYHTLELPGEVVTPGHFDTRPTAGKVPLPARLDGLRCLDVGTWDGFWAFEMERRGAASVTAIDLDDPARWDWPPRPSTAQQGGVATLEHFKRGAAAFRLAHEALGSRVERVDLSVYELSPERLGTFDVVFLGTLLMHLRDPVAALAALRSVTAGQAVIADAIDLLPTFTRPLTPVARLEGQDRPWWWAPNQAALLAMVRSAGFDVVRRVGPYLLPLGAGHQPRPPARRMWRWALSAHGRQSMITVLAGLPHVAVRAVPVPRVGAQG